jgi:uncharacterized protein YqeY
MPTLSERLESDYKTAMKAGERRRIDTLRLVKAAMQRVAIEQRKDALDDKDVLQVLAHQAKQRRETLESAKQGGRADIAAQAQEELAIVESYLPQQLSSDAVKRLIEEAVQAVGANQGQMMKYVMGKAAGAADGKLVSQLVGERLKQSPSPK